MKTKHLILFALILVFVNVSAQEGYTLKKDSLQSVILNQNRKLSIYLPDGYNSSKIKFPVLYVLDGKDRCQHIVPTARFLSQNNKIPKVIVVGVSNIDRNHDFLPDSSQNAQTGGGADNFLRFFKNELIPYIDKNFNTDHFTVLIGHSYGGVFSMHALLHDPELFSAYIAIDPSFWYKKEMQVKSAKQEFLKAKNWNTSIYITGREGDGMKNMGITSMEKQLKTSAPKELNWKIAAYPNEDHGSVTFKSVYDGLRFIFDAGGNFYVYPLAGILPKGALTYALIENSDPNLRYTIDGSEPTINSPLCKDRIKINKACTLKVKNVSSKYNKQPSIIRVFAEGDYMTGQQSVENLKPGLKYSYYEGAWDSIPDFSKLTPKKTGITDLIDLKTALKKDSFAVEFEGYLHITKKALYNIWIVSDDGSKVFFNNELLLNNDGLHAAERPVVKLVPLNPGYYPIKVQCFEKNGGEDIKLGYLVGYQKPIPIPKEMFFYKEK